MGKHGRHLCKALCLVLFQSLATGSTVPPAAYCTASIWHCCTLRHHALTLGYVLVDRVASWSRKHLLNGAIHGGRASAYVIEDEYGDQVVKTAYQCNQAAAYARLLLQKEAGKLG